MAGLTYIGGEGEYYTPREEWGPVCEECNWPTEEEGHRPGCSERDCDWCDEKAGLDVVQVDNDWVCAACAESVRCGICDSPQHLNDCPIRLQQAIDARRGA